MQKFIGTFLPKNERNVHFPQGAALARRAFRRIRAPYRPAAAPPQSFRPAAIYAAMYAAMPCYAPPHLPGAPRRLRIPPAGQPPRLLSRACPAMSAPPRLRGAPAVSSRRTCPAMSAPPCLPAMPRRTFYPHRPPRPFRAGTPAAQKHTARKETPSAPLPFWFFRRYACFGFFGVMPVLVFSALCLFCFFGVMPVCEAPCAAPPCASAARRSCRRAYRPPPPAAGRGRARC